MGFDDWFDDYLEEKQIDRGRILQVEIFWGNKCIPLETMVDEIKSAGVLEQNAIREALSIGDIQTDDLYYYFYSLAEDFANSYE